MDIELSFNRARVGNCCGGRPISVKVRHLLRSCKPEAPNQMWGTDATATFTEAEGAVTMFAAIDHCAAECVGIHVVKRATRFEALEPIHQGAKEYFTGFSAGGAIGLGLRHDHGVSR